MTLLVWHRDGQLDAFDKLLPYDSLLGCRFRGGEVRFACCQVGAQSGYIGALIVLDWDGTSLTEVWNINLVRRRVSWASHRNALSPDARIVVFDDGTWVDLVDGAVHDADWVTAFGPSTRFLQWSSQAGQATFYSPDTNDVVFWAPESAVSTTHALTARPETDYPITVSPDGRRLVYFISKGTIAICEGLQSNDVKRCDLARLMIPSRFGALQSHWGVRWKSDHELVLNVIIGRLAVVDAIHCDVMQVTPPMQMVYDFWCSQTSGRLVWIAHRGQGWELDFR